MQALLDVILPVFVVLGFGYLAAWRGLISAAGIDGLMRFAQNFAIPCLLFRSISRLDLATAYDPALLLAFYAGAAAAAAAGYVIARRLLARTPTEAIAIAFAASFSNTLLLGLPITERAYGPDALAGNYAIISFHAPLLYAIGITAMEIARSRGQALLSRRALGVQIGRAILTQPLVIGILAGLALNLTGLPLPGVIESALGLMVQAALPVALFGLGGVLFRYRPEGDGRAIAMVVGASLVLHPAVTLSLGHAFGLGPDQMRSAVITAAMAPGVNAYLFAFGYAAAPRVTASSVLLGTAACILTTWAWLQVLP
jgi:malonate transporter and related proteins